MKRKKVLVVSIVILCVITLTIFLTQLTLRHIILITTGLLFYLVVDATRKNKYNNQMSKKSYFTLIFTLILMGYISYDFYSPPPVAYFESNQANEEWDGEYYKYDSNLESFNHLKGNTKYFPKEIVYKNLFFTQIRLSEPNRTATEINCTFEIYAKNFLSADLGGSAIQMESHYLLIPHNTESLEIISEIAQILNLAPSGLNYFYIVNYAISKGYLLNITSGYENDHTLNITINDPYYASYLLAIDFTIYDEYESFDLKHFSCINRLNVYEELAFEPLKNTYAFLRSDLEDPPNFNIYEEITQDRTLVMISVFLLVYFIGLAIALVNQRPKLIQIIQILIFLLMIISFLTILFDSLEHVPYWLVAVLVSEKNAKVVWLAVETIKSGVGFYLVGALMTYMTNFLVTSLELLFESSSHNTKNLEDRVRRLERAW